jgi:adenosylcobinamide-GDP ribazoletransferase
VTTAEALLDRVHLAHTFLTRIPLPSPRGTIDAERFARCAVAFPLVGLTVGAAAGLVRVAADPVGPLFAVVAALAVVPLITGAFHEDGLADSADGLGPLDRDRRLEAMRDSRLGTFGVLALVFSVLARVALLAPLGVRNCVLALIAGHVLGRWSTLPLAWRSQPTQPDGLGTFLLKPRKVEVAWGSAVAFAVAAPALVAVHPTAVPVAIAVALIVTLATAELWKRAFGGVTGDTYGATNQLVEIATLAAVAAVL